MEASTALSEQFTAESTPDKPAPAPAPKPPPPPPPPYKPEVDPFKRHPEPGRKRSWPPTKEDGEK